MVRLGVTQWSLDGHGPETVYEAARLGFSAIHLDAGALDGEQLLDDPARQDAYLEAAQQAGVQITAIAPGLNDYGVSAPAGSENARRAWRLIEIAIAAAVRMRVPLVFFPSFRVGEIRTEPDLQRTAEVLRAACDLAAPHALTLATENTLGLDGNLALLSATSRPNLRVLLDTQNPSQWGHGVPALAAGLWPHLADQVHVKDGTGGQMGNAVLGAGTADFAETARTLRSLGFEGLLISENDYRGERRAAAAQDIAVLSGHFGLPAPPSP